MKIWTTPHGTFIAQWSHPMVSSPLTSLIPKLISIPSNKVGVEGFEQTGFSCTSTWPTTTRFSFSLFCSHNISSDMFWQTATLAIRGVRDEWESFCSQKLNSSCEDIKQIITVQCGTSNSKKLQNGGAYVDCRTLKALFQEGTILWEFRDFFLSLSPTLPALSNWGWNSGLSKYPTSQLHPQPKFRDLWIIYLSIPFRILVFLSLFYPFLYFHLFFSPPQQTLQLIIDMVFPW